MPIDSSSYAVTLVSSSLHLLLPTDSLACWLLHPTPPFALTIHILSLLFSPSSFLLHFTDTPLGLVCGRHSHVQCIMPLLSGGAHIDFRGKDGLTPLHRAAIGGNSQAVKVQGPIQSGSQGSLHRLISHSGVKFQQFWHVFQTLFPGLLQSEKMCMFTCCTL